MHTAREDCPQRGRHRGQGPTGQGLQGGSEEDLGLSLMIRGKKQSFKSRQGARAGGTAAWQVGTPCRSTCGTPGGSSQNSRPLPLISKQTVKQSKRALMHFQQSPGRRVGEGPGGAGHGKRNAEGREERASVLVQLLWKLERNNNTVKAAIGNQTQNTSLCCCI